jgi:hypothetical protein
MSLDDLTEEELNAYGEEECRKHLISELEEEENERHGEEECRKHLGLDSYENDPEYRINILLWTNKIVVDQIIMDALADI